MVLASGNRCSVITVISESTKEQLLRHLNCDPGKIRVIHCPVSDEFKPSYKLINRACPRILQVGTSVNKNILRTAEALEDLSCRLVIIGPLSDLQKRALIRHRIDYQNYVGLSREELMEQYKQSDLVMFPSLYEGFGLPIAEPMLLNDTSQLRCPVKADVVYIRSKYQKCRNKTYIIQLVETLIKWLS